MKKTTSIILMNSFLFTGCTYQISEGLSDNGKTVQTLVFPNPDDAWKKEGIFPVKESLRTIQSGISKNNLYDLIGTPHFSEAKNAREWDYLFKFKSQDGNKVDIFQFKIIFDKDYLGQSFYWKPSACAKYIEAKTGSIKVSQSQSITKPSKSNHIEIINLNTDALFSFNKWKVDDISLTGKQSLDNLANKIKTLNLSNRINIDLIGHTDRLGSQSHNQELSQRRADTVKSYLVNQGINQKNIRVFAAADTNPKTSCYGIGNKQQLIHCLKPNRRVEVIIKRQ